MRFRSAFLSAGFVFLTSASFAADNSASTSAAPWVDDLALINQTRADVQARGIMALADHRERLEKALAGGKHSEELAAAARPTSYVLTEGPADSLVAMMLAATDKPKDATSVVAVEDPYPAISFYLASYYDEMGKPEEALRVLDLGLTFSTLPDMDTGETRGLILVERGAALEALHRWQDVLQNEDRGLKMEDLDNHVKAAFYRGRGYALTELNQLDDAEAAYEQSLNLDPGNKLAEGELKYIDGLKSGAPRAAPGTLTKVQRTGSDATPQNTPQ
jgi:tetratricopeptide (TPR) repeat protein